MPIDISFDSAVPLSSSTLSQIERVYLLELGESYELSVLFTHSTESKRLNETYRDKPYPTNILSFPFSEISGEIVIDLEQCLKEHESFDREFDNFILFLFIHGVMHLKGFDHGEKMEEEEKRVRTIINV